MPQINVSKKGYITGSTESNQVAARDASSGTHVDATGNESIAIQWFRSSGRGGGSFRYKRTFLYFDTSGVTGTVSSCTLKVSGYSNTGGDVIGVKSTAFGGDGATNLADDDFNNITWGTVYTNQLETWSTSDTNDFTLTAAALTDIKNNDYFIIALVEHDSDYADVDTGDGHWSSGVNFGGTLQLDYTLAPTGYGNDINGVSSSNISKVKGVATANIEKVIGV
jgi:hypothetical protein|tara:strand:+ start:56332 stop:57000 length:669 start_codon:yes stop_codon:yes gene_type:complete